MRGLPSFSDRRLEWDIEFGSIGPLLSLFDLFWSVLTPFGLSDAFWSLLALFAHFWAVPVIWEVWNEYETVIETWYFWWKWGVYQVSTTKGSWDIDFGSMGPFWPLMTSFGPFRPLLVLFEHFRSSENYEINMKQSLEHGISDWNEGFTRFLRPKFREI